jgi:mannosyl-oligosaccharide alpha-1,2-mannosidase
MPEIAQLEPCETIDGKCLWADKPVEKKDKLPEGFVRVRDAQYRLRPEAIESVFYMWRITGDNVWREAAWRMWQAITDATETADAFAVISDVNDRKSEKQDSMEVSLSYHLTRRMKLTLDRHSGCPRQSSISTSSLRTPRS